MCPTDAPRAARRAAATTTTRTMLVCCLLALAAAVLPQAAAAQAPAGEDKALGRPATASTTEQEPFGNCAFGVCPPGNATDGRPDTRWASAFSDGHFWQVDLGSARLVDAVSVDWQFAYAARYEILTSLDGTTFTPVAAVSLPPGLRRDHWVERTAFAVTPARYVRINALRRAQPRYGFSFYTVSVFGPDEAALAPPPPAPAPEPPASPASAPGAAPATPGAAAGSGPATAPGGAAGTVPGASAPEPPAALRPIGFTTVRLRGAATSTGARIEVLSVRAPRAATVRVRCKGRGCPRRVPTRRGTRRIPEVQRRLGVGAVIEVFVTQPGTYGRYTRFEIRRRRAPLRTDACVVAGRPATCPDS
jgi:hypothetical protein